MKTKYYRISEDGMYLVEVPTDKIKTPTGMVFNPKHAHMIEAKAYPLAFEIPEDTATTAYVLTGYTLDENIDAIVPHYKTIEIIDNPPEIEENEYLYDAGWTGTETSRVHNYEVLEIVDPGEPELAEDKILVDDYWWVDLENKKYVHEYVTKTVVDNPPTVEENQRLVHRGWIENETERVHQYDVYTVVEAEHGECQVGYHFSTYETVDEETKTITIHFEMVEDPPPPEPEEIRVSKMRLEIALARLGALKVFDDFIDNHEDVDVGEGSMMSLRRLYDKATELNTNDSLFKPFFGSICSALGITEEAAIELISNCRA